AIEPEVAARAVDLQAQAHTDDIDDLQVLLLDLRPVALAAILDPVVEDRDFIADHRRFETGLNRADFEMSAVFLIDPDRAGKEITFVQGTETNHPGTPVADVLLAQVTVAVGFVQVDDQRLAL